MKYTIDEEKKLIILDKDNTTFDEIGVLQAKLVYVYEDIKKWTVQLTPKPSPTYRPLGSIGPLTPWAVACSNCGKRECQCWMDLFKTKQVMKNYSDLPRNKDC